MEELSTTARVTVISVGGLTIESPPCTTAWQKVLTCLPGLGGGAGEEDKPGQEEEEKEEQKGSYFWNYDTG